MNGVVCRLAHPAAAVIGLPLSKKVTMNPFIILLVAFGLVLSGCAAKTVPLQTNANLQVTDQTALPVPLREDQAQQSRPYLVGPFDELTISVFGIADLSAQEVQVDAAGNVSFPLVGSIPVAGKTPGEVEAELERRLTENFIRNPQVSVNLTKTVSQVITIDGQVTKPGLYPVVGKLTLMQAVATAQGTTEFAKLDDIVVFRNSGGQRYAALYNLGAIRRGVYNDPEMFAGDVVIVGDSTSRRLFRDVLAAAPLLVAPIIAILQSN